MSDIVFLLIGGFFVLIGLAAVMNIGDTADRLAEYNARQSDSPQRRWERQHRPDRAYPQSRTGMRLWGAAALFCGLMAVWAGLSW